MEAQCWICPYCFDDHSQNIDCKTVDLEERISRLKSDLAQVQDSHKRQCALNDKVHERLKEAEKMISFYADPESWINRIIEKDVWSSVVPDEEMILGYKHPGTDWNGTVRAGGKKAREYLIKNKKDKI